MFDRLAFIIDNKTIVKKGFNSDAIIHDLINLSPKKLSSIMSSSADIIDTGKQELLDNELIHIVSKYPPEKFALTYKGIVYAINLKDNVAVQDQYLSFLKAADYKFNKIKTDALLTWKEKVAALTLLLSTCTNELSAIQLLNNTSNQDVFESTLQDVVNLLEEYKILKHNKKGYNLPNKKSIRGESPAQFFMRMEGGKNLAIKTNQIFVRSNFGYYLDIEKTGEIDDVKITFLLKLIFSRYDSEVNYNELKNSLINLSEKVYPAFLERNVNMQTFFTLTNKIDLFFTQEIWNL